MTTPNTPDRDQAPTVAEIADLTRRLRDLCARGRDADAGERAAFLADKDALLARIANTDTASAGPVRHTHAAISNRVTRDPDVRWSARATGADGSTATFDSSGYYSDAHLSAIAAAREAGDTEQAEALQNAPWIARCATADSTHAAITDDPTAETYAEAEVRREQLTRWHHDDHPAASDDQVTDVDVAMAQDGTDHPAGLADGCDAGAGWDR